MSVVCKECKGTNVLCEAMVNPNTKDISHYTDESFLHGWCNDCRIGVELMESIIYKIEESLKEFKLNHGMDPLYAICNIKYNNDSVIQEDMIIKLSSDVGNDNDQIFFYCDGIEGFKSLAWDNALEDFTVVGLKYFL